MTGEVQESGRRSRTRRALMDAAERLFAEQSPEGVTIDDIVGEAKVAKGTFYNHFADRDALVRAILVGIRSRAEAAVDAVNAGVEDPAHRTVRGVCAYIRFAVDEPLQARIVLRLQAMRLNLDSRLNQGLRADLSAGLAKRRFTLATTEAAMILVMGAANSAMLRALEDPAVAVPLAQQVSAMLLKAFGVPAEEAEQIGAISAEEVVGSRD